MKIAQIAAAIAFLSPVEAMAVNRAHISPAQMLAAIRSADPIPLDGIRISTLTTSSIRIIRCTGPDEEPTEFECIWQTRGKMGWTTHKSWLAINGKEWHFIDR